MTSATPGRRTVIVGPPGLGKIMLARQLAQRLHPSQAACQWLGTLAIDDRYGYTDIRRSA